jgi:hypothetical protein
MSKDKQTKELVIIGWREMLALPQLGIEKIKAKIDTGARTSALHAFDLDYFTREDQEMVKFKVHPYQKDSHTTISAEAKLLEHRTVTNSGGYGQFRPVIKTQVQLGSYQWEIELTLTNRDVMGFRMLLGRQAVKKRFLVDSSKSFLQKQI